MDQDKQAGQGKSHIPMAILGVKPATGPATGHNGCNLRAPTPAEVAEQLRRDATSLTLTGASFEKDKQFYDNVAANLHEAANMLANWERTVAALRRDEERSVAAAHQATLDAALETAACLRRSVGVTKTELGAGWLAALDAFCAAMEARTRAFADPDAVTVIRK